jgi:hypothetical protein
MVTVTTVTVTTALAVFVGSALLVAVIVCVPAVAGAVYCPVIEIVPVAVAPPTTPSTDQVTFGFGVPVTVAKNCLVVFEVTVAVVGLMLIATTVTVTAALADCVLSALLVTVTVCEPAVVGAEYCPVIEIVPVAVAPPTTPSTDQVTFGFVVPVTVAVNCFVVLTVTDAVVGLMLIETVVTVTVALAV